MRKLSAPLIPLSIWLAGCGQQPAAAIAPIPAPSRPAPVAAPDVRLEGMRLLAAVRDRLASCRGFDTEMASFAEGTWDDGEDKGVRRTNRNRAQLRWTRPHQLHGEMLEAPFALMVGGTLDTTDGQTLTLRPKGLLSVVALTVSATDVKLRSSRNHTFRDSNPAAQLTRLTGPTAAWTVVGTAPGVVSLEVTGVRRLDAGIDREVVTLAPQDLALRAIVMHADSRQVVSNTFKGFRWR